VSVETLQVENWVAYKLPGSMISGVATPVDPVKGDTRLLPGTVVPE
jgi:hypothetical protein